MNVKVLMMAAAGVGWLAASLMAFVIVALVDFLGIGLIGVFIAFASSQVELESGNNAGGAYAADMLQRQTESERQMSPERTASRHDRSLVVNSARFFRHFGLGLALIGFGGFAYRYL
jgi:hypothetical protein